MFSADNAGLIIVWKTPVTGTPDSKQLQPCHRWCIEKVRNVRFTLSNEKG